MTNPFLGKKVLVVTAHPDDEAPTAAGTLRQVVESGGEVRLLCATLGENGKAYLAEELSLDALKRLRLSELNKSADIIGASSVVALDLGDGQVAEQYEELLRYIRATMYSYNPDMLLSFGPDGYTGHADHVAVHRAVSVAAAEAGVALVMFALPPEPWRGACVDVLYRKRKFGNYHDGEAAVLPTVCVQVDAALKKQAIQAHASQLQGLDPELIFPADYARHSLEFEYFVS